MKKARHALVTLLVASHEYPVVSIPISRVYKRLKIASIILLESYEQMLGSKNEKRLGMHNLLITNPFIWSINSCGVRTTIMRPSDLGLYWSVYNPYHGKII